MAFSTSPWTPRRCGRFLCRFGGADEVRQALGAKRSVLKVEDDEVPPCPAEDLDHLRAGRLHPGPIEGRTAGQLLAQSRRVHTSGDLCRRILIVPATHTLPCWLMISKPRSASPRRSPLGRSREIRDRYVMVSPSSTGWMKRTRSNPYSATTAWPEMGAMPVIIETRSSPCAMRVPNGPSAAKAASLWSGFQSPLTALNSAMSDSVTVRPRVPANESPTLNWS